jgi:hypothetical protein
MGALKLKYYLLPSPKGMCVEIRACAMDPMQVFPTGRCLQCQRGIGSAQTTTSGAAPTSPSEGVFHSILHLEHGQAVRMHYLLTRTHQACYNPRHRRDSGAGTMILYYLCIYHRTQPLPVATMGLMGLLEYGQRSSIRRGRRTFQGLCAGQSSRRRRLFAWAAEPSVGLRAGRSSGQTMQEYIAARGRLNHATFRGQADASARCTGLGVKLYSAMTGEARAWHCHVKRILFM